LRQLERQQTGARSHHRPGDPSILDCTEALGQVSSVWMRCRECQNHDTTLSQYFLRDK